VPESKTSKMVGRLWDLRFDIDYIGRVMMNDIQTALVDTEDAPPDVVDALRDELRRLEMVRANHMYELRQIEEELSKLPPTHIGVSRE